ncbi:MAG: 2-(1,2-epoxy-1,2-dihydrophenyl)acetyl-CoA isomerase PaaG [Gammaproteobacteria bacterium]|nr:2-(1,2-epoxy-1,2-dihydrophenyl)acetyl-CoA isomerase PaaG [Gammaproteobacteria bacterium]
MAYQTIELQISAGVAEIALNRPAKLNSFTHEMHSELRDALAAVEANETVRCLLLTGRGRGFCAGQDLHDRIATHGSGPPDLGESLQQNYNPLVRSLTTMQRPVIAAVNGVAAGAGANIALACDIVLAAQSASFVQAFCRLGLIPDSGGSWLLPRLIGRARAMGLAMLGDKLSAEQAADWGLIWQCLPDAELLPRARQLAAHLATQPTAGLAKIKHAIYAASCNSLDAQLDLERDLQQQAGHSADYREGVEAFVHKREPRFVGD